MELDVRALFSVPPEEFVATRNRLAGDARSGGEPDLARRIRELRRPTVSAWAVNLLAYEDPDRLGRLLDVGDELRAAWARGTGLGEPERRRSELIAELVRQARTLTAAAGHPVREEALREVEETLNAATIDPDTAEEVRTGRLVRTLSYSGFAPPGTVTVPAVRAATPAPRKPRRESAAEERRLRLRRLQVEADETAERAATAIRDQAEWRSELDTARAELTVAEGEAERLREALREREAARDTAERRVRLAERELGRATRSAATAKQRAGEARQQLEAPGS